MAKATKRTPDVAFRSEDGGLRQQALPLDAIAFLDTLIEHGDWSAKNLAIRALGQIGFYHGLDAPT